MTLVLDCSIAAAWLLPDEQSEVADRAIEAVMQAGAHVPAIFLLEIANVLVANARRGRLPSASAYLSDVLALELREDLSAGAERVAEAAALAERHALTVYDAAYLELAQRLSVPLATLDADLARAAAAAGVPLFDQ